MVLLILDFFFLLMQLDRFWVFRSTTQTGFSWKTRQPLCVRKRNRKCLVRKYVYIGTQRLNDLKGILRLNILIKKYYTLRLVLYTVWWRGPLVYRVRLLTFNFALWAFVYAGVVGGSVSRFHFISWDLILYSFPALVYSVCGRACSTVT